MECDITITVHKNVTISTWSDLSHDWSLCIKILEVNPMYVVFCPACSRRGSPRAFHFVSHILSFRLNLVINFHTIWSCPGPTRPLGPIIASNPPSAFWNLIMTANRKGISNGCTRVFRQYLYIAYLFNS